MTPEEIQNKRILFSPLNWGWGHVSRSIALLKRLQSQNNVIYLACSSKQRMIYEAYFEDIQYLELEGYPFRFNGKGKFHWDVFSSLPQLYSFARKEKKWVSEQVLSLHIDILISDHRYAFHSNLVETIFVTHQLNLPTPSYLAPVRLLHRSFVNKFSKIWLVDDPKIQLAGKLAETKGWDQQKIAYTGVLSRFSKLCSFEDRKWTTVLISGPDVHAKQFYEEQKHRIQEEDTCLIYKGMFYSKYETRAITWKEIDQLMLATKVLIARSGYSTLMDVHFLACETEWYPTPGQWEQEYLFQCQHKKNP